MNQCSATYMVFVMLVTATWIVTDCWA